MPDLIQYEGGEVLANLTDRTVTGLLVPFNELGQTNAGRFMVEAGALALPSDPSVISLNVDHERSANVGRATRVWEQEGVGIMATFAYARTPEGDAALADALNPAGARRRLSGEFHTAILAGKAVKGSGRLWGAGQVKQGAFPSAMVLASDTTETSSKYVTEYVDEQGVKWTRAEDSTTTTEATDTGTTQTTVTTVTEEQTASTTEPEGEAIVPEATATVQATIAAPAGVPATALPAGAAAPAGTTLTRLPSPSTIFAAIATMRDRMQDDSARAEARTVLAALEDITPGGTNPLTAPGVVQPNWVGQIAEGVPYVREYINLCNLGTDISLAGKKGYKVRRGTTAAPVDHFDGSWAGNKSTVKSYKGFTSTVESVRDNFAIAEDIAREYRDLPGGEEAVAAFMGLIIEDHLVWSDETALSYIIDTAGAPVAPTTARYPENYPPALGMLIQGILAVKRRKADGRRDTPTFAIANDQAYEELIYAAGGEQNLPAFVSIALSTDGTGTADGNVQVVNGETGIAETASVVVGAKYAIDFDEIAGGPLRIDALDIARGGLDEAVHGYLQTFVKRPEAVVLVGVADETP